VETTLTIDDDELAAEALAADPDAAVPADAVPLGALDPDAPAAVLPQWYMPTPGRTRAFTGWRRRLVRLNVALIVASFVAINAAGLCNTYGQLHF
jgi:hypothetical protein